MTLPKLNKRETARLIEIGEKKCWCSDKPLTNDALETKGLVRSVRSVGDLQRHLVLTDLGRQVLAGLPERTP